jgi:hypothetical protein
MLIVSVIMYLSAHLTDCYFSVLYIQKTFSIDLSLSISLGVSMDATFRERPPINFVVYVISILAALNMRPQLAEHLTNVQLTSLPTTHGDIAFAVSTSILPS